MNRFFIRWLLAGCLSLLLLSWTRAEELTVFAAASLSDVLREIAPRYEAETGVSLRFNFGSSGLLARQIKEGARADVFFSADEARMDELAAAGLVVAGTRRSLLANTLVIIVPADAEGAIATPADLVGTRVRRLALGETQSVPAGIYAREYLTGLGLWEKLAAKVVPLANVRATLAAVASGNADAGMVYRTDALGSRQVRIAYAVPAAEGPAISYPVAVIAEGRAPSRAGEFVNHLASAEARALFVRHGFLPLED